MCGWLTNQDGDHLPSTADLKIPGLLFKFKKKQTNNNLKLRPCTFGGNFKFLKHFTNCTFNFSFVLTVAQAILFFTQVNGFQCVQIDPEFLADTVETSLVRVHILDCIHNVHRPTSSGFSAIVTDLLSTVVRKMPAREMVSALPADLEPIPVH